MVESGQDGWRRVVAGYLRALYDDARTRHERELSNALAEFLREFAAESLLTHYAAAARTRLDLLLPPLDESRWEVVEEAEDRVLVELNVPETSLGHQVPFSRTRVPLASQDGSWRIKNVLEPCWGWLTVSTNV
jgi:hypothetical protein